MKRKFRQLTVNDSQRLTPNMQRLWLSGDSLADFPMDADGAYIKLLFDNAGNAIADEQQIETLDGRPVMRTYTVRSFDPVNRQIVVDFVRHQHDGKTGPASAWADRVQPGDAILIGGPGPAKRLQTDADWVFLAADMTALPALSANLEQLGEQATGLAVIEVISEKDVQPLNKPDGVELHWVINPEPGTPNTVLADAVRRQSWRSGQVSAWAACEFSNMRAIRQYFKQERDVARDYLYVSSYWKMGNSEEEHKVVKREDAETA
ncbi:siderophore-interacting protein [Reinekea blandensis]|nr:siderophore-interacting protein [Reinekea blandensis]